MSAALHVPHAPSGAQGPRITLLTDFGTADGYVAAMKGAIAQVAPSVIIDDASHEIPPGDVHAAAWALDGYWRFYPAGTVHVVVVDPGVGSARRGLAIECDGRFLVGPDNGVFTHALRTAAQVRAVTIENRTVIRETVAATFHGRDVFAPAAAYLASGFPLDSLGAAATDLLQFDVPAAAAVGARVRGVVIHVDRFGNLITNIGQELVTGTAGVTIGGRRIPRARTYADVGSGELLALVGSRGLLEISVRDGSAAERLQAGRGALVSVEP